MQAPSTLWRYTWSGPSSHGSITTRRLRRRRRWHWCRAASSDGRGRRMKRCFYCSPERYLDKRTGHIRCFVIISGIGSVNYGVASWFLSSLTVGYHDNGLQQSITVWLFMRLDSVVLRVFYFSSSCHAFHIWLDHLISALSRAYKF